MPYKNISLALLIVVLSSCTSNRTPNLNTMFEQQTSARVVQLEYPSEQVTSTIMQFMADNNKIIITDVFGEHLFNTYTTQPPYQYKPAVLRGRGTNEAIQAISVSISNDTLYFLTPDKKYNMIASMDTPTPTITPINEIRGENLYLTITKGHKGYIATGVFSDSDAQFASLNDDFSVNYYFDSYPEYPTANHPTADLAFGIQGQIKHITQKQSFIYTSHISAVIKFFGYKNGKYEKVNEYLFHKPSFENINSKGQTIAYSKDNINGVLSSTSDKNYYYLLFDPREFGNRERNSDAIYVFDTEGNPVKKIGLDLPVEFIAYDNTSDRMFAIGQKEAEYYLYEILLND